MKPGSKAWVNMMRKVYFLSRFILLICINIKFLQWVEIIQLSTSAEIILKIGFVFSLLIFSIIHFLSMFGKDYEEPNWALVFPELRRQKTKK